MSDLDSRFASVGVAKSSFILDPKFKEPPSQSCCGAARVHSSICRGTASRSFCSRLHAAHTGMEACLDGERRVPCGTSTSTHSCTQQYFWPNFLDHLQTCPLVRRVVTAMIVLVHQNAEVERDLGFLKRIRDITLNKLADERYDSRCRIMVSDEPDEKERGKRLTGFLAGVADVWSQMRRRQQCPAEKRVSPGASGINATACAQEAVWVQQAKPEAC